MEVRRKKRLKKKEKQGKREQKKGKLNEWKYDK